MPHCRLLIKIHAHEGRWHGAGEWPPSPARLFQALIAGAYLGQGSQPMDAAIPMFAWLETLAPPIIAAPVMRLGRDVTTYVPNNDLDAKDGDPANVALIRVPKATCPRLLAPGIPFLFLWEFDQADSVLAEAAITVADHLYQFGRGIDMAYARAEILGAEAAEALLERHPGPVHRPNPNARGGVMLRCPQAGTLASLIERHTQQTGRLKDGVLRQARQARFAMVGYECPPTRLLFDLKPAALDRTFQVWPLERIAELSRLIRDNAAARLAAKLPADIERVLIGRGAGQADKPMRLRIVPLPSIGHDETDPSIRRVLVEIPPDCPIGTGDLAWSFSGLDLNLDHETGEIAREGYPILAPSNDRAMRGHYGIGEGDGARVWQTVTPIVVPVRRMAGKMSGSDRSANESAASSAVRQALRHAGIEIAVATIRVQREPLFAKGARAETFAAGSRFDAARLWHAEITFAEPVDGPLIVGDGRYCGLGLMKPLKHAYRDALIFAITPETRPPAAARAEIVHALRRALMSLDRDEHGKVSLLFSGHEEDGRPACSGQHRHVYLLADDADGDGRLDRLGVVAPWRVDRSWTPSRENRRAFDRVVSGLTFLKAGESGVMMLAPASAPAADDPLFSASKAWKSRTPYRSARHGKRNADLPQALVDELLRDCERRGLPKPDIAVVDLAAARNGKVTASLRLQFQIAVEGPLLLGLDAHAGGGLFDIDHEGGY